jgi:serine/threonine protein phosphatase PrpC
MEVFSFSEKGRRENNEDYILTSQIPSDCSIFLMVDGMGGYQHGEVAASLPCETVAKYTIENYGKSEITQLLTQALTLANIKINEIRNLLKEKLGTTIEGAVIEGNKAYIIWLGDVRIYQFRMKSFLNQKIILL